MEIIFATGNRHKLEEAGRILGPGFTLKCPADYGITEDIPETGNTLKDTALQKATYIFEKTGLPCFSDDTGLFVDALDGAPGVMSARYAGEAKNPEDNMRKLLEQLKDIPAEKDGKRLRTARFTCVVAFVSKEGPRTFEGSVEGEIAFGRCGAGGFGYDPIFLPEEYGLKQSFAELSAEQKNGISHRGKAMRAFADFIKGQYNK